MSKDIQGYDLIKATEEELPLTPEQYRQKVNEVFTVNGPSGMTYSIRMPPPETMRLMVLQSADLHRAVGADGERPDNMLLMDDLAEKYLPSIIVKPKIVARTNPDEAQRKSALFVDELMYQDRLAILTWAMSSDEILPLPSEVEVDQQFPDESSGNTASQSS